TRKDSVKLMKVSTGKFKQTKLLSPKVKNSRPTDNKVKEAIMDMLYPLEKDYLMLDLFSCTGQMGIEFLSRGTKKVYFNEINRSNFKLLKQNLDKFEGIDYECFNNDFRTTLKILSTKKINFGYIYLDPPYKSDYVDKSLKLIIKY